jgi:hypothetical protein
LRPQWKASATWAVCATVLYSPWLNQICEAGEQTQLAERRRKRSSGTFSQDGRRF